MAETNAIDTWIYSQLAGDEQLAALVGTRIYADQAPSISPPAPLPCVIYSYLSGVDLAPVGPYRVWTDCLYLVRGVAEQNSYLGNLKTIADRIEAVLHARGGSNAHGTIHACARVRAHRLPDPPIDGRILKNLGGQYRIYASIP